ncbi:hypothetical protein LINPERPRIM_LOCUS11899 [Linum perenne]
MWVLGPVWNTLCSCNCICIILEEGHIQLDRQVLPQQFRQNGLWLWWNPCHAWAASLGGS